MKTHENTMQPTSKRRLATLLGAELDNWSATLPVDGNESERSWGFVRLNTTKGVAFLCLFEGQRFPDTVEMEVLDAGGFQERLAKAAGFYRPEEWYPVRVGKTIRGIRVFTDMGTDVRDDAEGGTVVLDTCGIAFDLDDGNTLLLEKAHTESEVWDISLIPSGKARPRTRTLGKTVCECI